MPKFEASEITDPIPLLNSFEAANFDCGTEALNTYLKKYALQNNRNNSSKTYVALKNGIEIIGYFSLSFGSVGHMAAPTRVSHGLGRYPAPILILTRLAIDKSYQNIGLGRFLVKHTFLKALNAAEIGGLRAVVVHAKDEKAKGYYEKFGFVPSPLDSLHLFCLLKDIQESVKII
jgi:GNAT superfamily N-acetyltransferase